MTAREHLNLVRSLPCVVCKHLGLAQSTETEAHHLESVRDEHSDWATVSVCQEHHRGPNGVHGLSRRAFEMRYRLSPVDLIALTIRALDREGVIA